MRQEMTTNGYTRDTTESKNPDTSQQRALTYDETKAAEAAFRGEPFNPAWSTAAARVYAGILSAIENRLTGAHADLAVAEECLTGR